MAKDKRKLKPFAWLANFEGQNEKDSDFFIQPSSAKKITNLHYSKDGQVSNYEQGYTAFTSQLESGAGIDGLKYYREADGSEHLLTAVNGKLLDTNYSTGATTATITSGLTAGELLTAAIMNGEVYYGDGTATVRHWDGTTDAAITAFSDGSNTYDHPEILINYSNRMVQLNFNGYTSHIAISDLLDPETCTVATTNDTDGLITQINPGDGYELKAAERFYNAAANLEALVIFKEKGIYLLTGTTPSTFSVQQIRDDIGCLNKNCVARVGPDVFFLDENNVYSFTTSLQNGTLQQRALGSDKVKETLATMNLTYKHKAWVQHMPWRREVWFAIPTGASQVADTILVYRYRTDDQIGTQQAFWTVRKNAPTIAGLAGDKRLFTGTSDGYVNEWFGVSTYNGTGINFNYCYAPHGFGNPAQIKQVKQMYAWFKIREDINITVKTRWQNSRLWNQSTNLSKRIAVGDLPLYNAAVFGAEEYGESGGQLRMVPLRPYGGGNQLEVEIAGTTGATGIEFLGITGFVEFGSPLTVYR